jgi:uncharacterized protein (TIGR00730 family)
MTRMNAICVFCGSATGVRPVHRDNAARLGALIAGAGIHLVFGGGHAGLMGALADGALAAGGQVTGVIPGHLVRRELGHEGVGELRVVESMHGRKQTMFELSDAFVALPGGYGTLDETFEMITWKQLGLHDKPVVVVDSDGYWRRLDGLVDFMVAEGFVSQQSRDLYTTVPSVDHVLPALAAMPAAVLETDPSRL